MRFTRPLALVIALFLCGSQIAAAQHGIDHLVAPPDHACTQCLHQPGQKHALVDCDSGAVVAASEPAVLFNTVPRRNGASPNPYQSRAPPISLR